MIVSKTILHHERNQRRLVVMHMYNIGMVFPVADPINNSNLESNKPFNVISVAINFIAVEQIINVYQIKVKTQNVVGFFYYCIVKPIMPHTKIAFMNNFK